MMLTVMVNGRMGGAPTFGAGIIFNRSGDRLQIVTAAHVVRRGTLRATDLKVRLLNAEKLLAARVLPSIDPELDIAVLQVDGLAAQGIDPCSLPVDALPRKSNLARGSSVFAIGNPNGAPWAIPPRPDAVASIVPPEITFQSNVIAVGHSGGALVDDKAALVGLIRGDEPPYGIAIDIARVFDTLRASKFAVELVPAVRERTLPLHEAVRYDDAEAARSLLSQPCIGIESLEQGRTPLQIAAGFERLEMARLLLDHGANVNAQSDGESPLEIAARHESSAMTRLLLERGATPTPKALFNAVQKGKPEVVKALIAAGLKPSTETLFAAIGRPEILKQLSGAGADVNVLDNKGHNLLYYAVQGGDTDSVRTLIEAGAKPAIPGQATLFGLSPNHHEIIAQLLAASASVGKNDAESIMYTATREGWADVITLLLARGVDPNAPSASAQYGPLVPLDTAVQYLRLDAVKALLDGGAQPDPKGVKPRPLVYVLHQYNGREVARLLIMKGAKPDSPDDGKRESPLGLALFERKPPDFELAALLISRGANANARWDGNTLLHEASFSGMADAVALLLKAGANVNSLDNEGHPPLLRASHNPEVVKLLLAAGAKVRNFAKDTPLLYYAADGRSAAQSESLRLLIAAGADVKTCDSPLHSAADGEEFPGSPPEMHRWQVESARIAVKAGAPVNLACWSGDAPLHVAARSGNTEMVRFLLSVGANRYARNGAGETPLAAAKKDEIKAMLRAGAPAAAPKKQAAK